MTHLRTKLMLLVLGLLGFITRPTSAQEPSGARPKRGFVPDQATATEVAIAVLKPIYGEHAVMSKRPYTVNLDGNVWVVHGTSAKKQQGGVPYIWISKLDGRILKVIHTR